MNVTDGLRRVHLVSWAPQKSGRVEEEGRHHEADVPGAVWGGGCGMNEKPLD